MCRVKFYFFPSLCSRIEREVIYIDTVNLVEKEEKDLGVNYYDEISKGKVIKCEESDRCL